MYKTISDKPDWLRTEQVTDIYSVSGCVSEDFDDWINYWKHNGYWFFDSPGIIENLSRIHGINLEGMRLFFISLMKNSGTMMITHGRHTSLKSPFQPM